MRSGEPEQTSRITESQLNTKIHIIFCAFYKYNEYLVVVTEGQGGKGQFWTQILRSYSLNYSKGSFGSTSVHDTA